MVNTMTDTRDSFDKLISDLRLASGAAQSMKRSGTAMLYDSFADRLTALQSGAGDAHVVPAGWTLVPIEPSWDMRNEGREFLIDGLEKEPEKLAYFLWKTMVAASPKELEKRDAAIDNAQGHDMGVV